MIILKNRPFIIPFKTVIKASTEGGKRIVVVEASNEEPDLEGDVILQKALLGSKKSFLENGHLDIDHLSEIGHTLIPPIPNPESYIVGRPIDVFDMGNGRTGVKGVLSSSFNYDPEKNKYDMLWETLTRNPPVEWRSSIFGYPVVEETVDCTKTSCSHGATRYLVKGLDWRSLAFTRHPVNDKIIGSAKIVSAKSFAAICKSERAWPDDADIFSNGQEPLISSMTGGLPSSIGGQALVDSDSFTHNAGTVGAVVGAQQSTSCPANLAEMYGEYLLHIKKECLYYNQDFGDSVLFFREHYMKCRGLPIDKADILAHALAHLLAKQEARKRF